MLDFSTASLDELSVLKASLEVGRREHADLDIPLFDEMYCQITAELEKRK